MKKLASAILSLVFVFSFAACSNSNSNSSSTNTTTQSQQSNSSESSKTTEETSVNNESSTAGSKTLVVYYSATGSTKAVAETIAQTANADTFEITPVEPYTSADLDWTDNNSRVSVEHNDESKRNVELTNTTPDNWEQYDTVFVGYPIWWGIAAWPVDGFITGNDFTGKTVIPFCTSASSGIGQSGELLAQMAGTGNWQDGKRFSSGASSDDVANWVNGLDLQ
ncbi:flavodoxin [Ruminococcus sp.]|uniref:flavodoxin n=1 Tax=Ruminococcus sp. TaxID=41978 RepID=UPI003866F161